MWNRAARPHLRAARSQIIVNMLIDALANITEARLSARGFVCLSLGVGVLLGALLRVC